MFYNLFLRRFVRASFGCLIAVTSLLLPRMAAGQSIFYSGVQSTLYGPTTYSHTPSPIAVDGAGDVFFVLETGTGGGTAYHMEELTSGSGTPTVLNNDLGFNPTAIAVNSGGTVLSVIYTGTGRSCSGHYSDIYIAQATISGGAVSFGGSNNLPWCFTLGTSGYYTTPSGLAVDSSGDLYIADSGAHRLYEIASGNTTPSEVLNLSGGEPVNLAVTAGGTVDFLVEISFSTYGVSYVSTSQFGTSLSSGAVTPTSLISDLSSNDLSLAVDALGNVYVGNSEAGPVRKIVGGAAINIDSRFGDGINGMGTDSSGNLYIAGKNSSSQLLIGEDGQVGSGNFGSVAVGSSASYTYTFTVNSAATVSGISVLFEGASGLDYQSTGGTCTTAHYAAESTCTVTVQFSPKEPGLRSGAVVFAGSSGVLGTGYLEGIGTGPAVAFTPGTQNTLASSVDDPSAIAVDGAQNLYVLLSDTGAIEEFPAGNGTPSTLATVPGANALAIDGAGNLYVSAGSNGVVEVTPAGTQTTVASTGITYADGVAVNGAGTVYILDTTAQSLLQLPQGGTANTWISGLNSPGGVAVDSAGNVYVGNDSGSEVLEIAPGGTQSAALSSLNGVDGLAVDAAGDIYLSFSGGDSVLQFWNGCTTSDCALSFGAGTTGLGAMTLDGAGNVYYSEIGATANVYELDRVDAPSLSFATTNIGSTSSDSPQSFSIQDIGNTSTNLTAISPGLSVGTGFDQVTGSGTPADCTATFSLTLGTSCNISISFEPVTGQNGQVSTTVTLSDNALNNNPATQEISLSGTAVAITLGPTSLGSVTVGQAYSQAFTATGGTGPYTYTLSTGSLPPGLQLNGGSLSGTPTAVGTYTFTIAVTDSNSESTSQQYTVTTNPPVITLGTLSPGTVGVSYAGSVAASGGTPPYTYSDTGNLPAGLQLNADGSITGTPTSAGTVPFTVTATDSTTGSGIPYKAVQTYNLLINKGTPAITWAAPASITYGAALSAAQLDATANVPGSFVYSPAAGTVPGAGIQTLGVTFTPTDQADYTTQTGSVQLTVNQATPTITWAAPPAILYGTALSATQLDATASVAGSFVYSPAAGTVLDGGTHTLSVTFTPTDQADYSTQTATVQIIVNQATSTITWAAPAPITYGAALSAVQLDATANVAGSFVYSPAAGTVLGGGAHTLSVTFTPTDQTDYSAKTATVQITVNPAVSGLTLTTSNASSNLNAAVTFTATVQSTAPGVASGSVEFLDGSTVLGTSPLNGQGTATYITSSLTAGTHTLNAVYSGDANFQSSTASVSQVVTAPAYSITATPPTLTLAAGQSGSVTLTLTPVGGFTGTITLGCSGLPNWVTCQATPAVLTANGSNTPQTSQLVITTLGSNSGTVNISSNTGGHPGNGSRVATASFFFLPGLLLGGFLAWERKKLSGGMKCIMMLLLVVSTMSGMVGCGFSRASAPPGSYTVTVTGTSSSTSSLYTGPANETVTFTLTITQ